MQLTLHTPILYITFALSIIFNGGTVYSQGLDSLKLDSLISVLTLQNEDEGTADAYMELSAEYLLIADYESSLEYAMLARDMAGHIGDKEREFYAIKRIAHIYTAYFFDFKQAVRHYDEALELADQLNSEDLRLQVFRGYAHTYAGVEDFESAARFNDKALEIARGMSNDQLVSELCGYGGDIYEELGDDAKAMELYEEVVNIEEASNFMNSSNVALTTVAHYYFLKEDYQKSLKHYRSSLERFKRLGEVRWVSFVHSEISLVYLAEGDLDRAEKHALAGLELAQELGLNKERADNYFVLAQVYGQKGDTENAKKYQDAYDALMDSVVVDLGDRSPNGEDAEPTTNSDASSSNSFLSLLIILGLTGLVVFISGLPRKKRG